MTGRHLELGESYRFGRGEKHDPERPSVDGVPNWFFVTAGPEGSASLFPQSGIYAPSSPFRDGVAQIPLIVCTTSPHKGGTSETPWTDVIRPDEGYAWYFGDNKTPGIDPSQSLGNKRLLQAMEMHGSSDLRVREMAPPVILLTTHGEGGAGKGYKRFEGLAVVTHAEQVLQRSPKSGQTFRNFRFELQILDLKDNNERLSISWINARRDPEGSLASQLTHAPAPWREFVRKGPAILPRLRRDVIRDSTRPSADQLPAPGSVLQKVLDGTLDFFDDRKHQFEPVAARIVEKVFEEQGLIYKTEFLTKRSGDGGYDFVGRLDIDPRGGFASSKQVLIGQAKCERRMGTSGKDVARLAARLHRGWYGAYVTTTFFTPATQQEIMTDRLPLLMVPGARVAAIIRDDLDRSRLSLSDYLSLVIESVEKDVGRAGSMGALLTSW